MKRLLKVIAIIYSLSGLAVFLAAVVFFLANPGAAQLFLFVVFSLFVNPAPF